MIIPALLLQKLSFKSRTKRHTLCLTRRMDLWKKETLTLCYVNVEQSIFANIDEATTAKAGMKTFDAAGPSGLDAIGWLHILFSLNYGDAERDLRSSLAVMARTLAT